MGGFLENLKKFFTAPPSQGESGFLVFNIKCNKCGEEIAVKIRRTSDISRIYEDEGGTQGSSFYVRKEILGNKCNNLIYLTAYFGENFNLLSSEISGGTIID
ncbi:MAG: hypothetical protein FJW69_01465 [Actinobacteria bacterium]|nr:hypothetical protein [Actinomycetota bacterium]